MPELVQNVKLFIFQLLFHPITLVRIKKKISKKMCAIGAHGNSNHLPEQRISTYHVNIIDEIVHVGYEILCTPLMIVFPFGSTPTCSKLIDMNVSSIRDIEALIDYYCHSFLQFHVGDGCV